MKTNLLNFFNERANILKHRSAIADDLTVNYTFIVSNYKENEHDCTEINSLSDLELAVSFYFRESNIEPKSRIFKTENLDQSRQMYVLLELPQ